MSNTLNLDPGAVSSANNQSHFEAGNGIAREAQEVYADGLHTFEHQAGWTDEQKAYADQRAAEWRGIVTKAYNERLHRRASWVPVSVAGPSNYPVKRMQKRMDAELKAADDWAGKMQRFLENTKATLRSMTPLDKQLELYRSGRWNDPISSDDPHALDKLRAKLQGLQDDQQRMKDINAYYRKHGTAKGCPGVTDAQAEKLDHGVDNKYSYQQSQPFQSWALQNNNGNMKRIKDRIAQLEKLQQSADAVPEEPQEFDGFRIEQCPEDNRVRIFFDGKPDESTRALLKSNGFRWSPKAGAWQRQLNSNGLYACRRIVKALAPVKEPEIPADPETLTPEEFLQRIG